MTTELEKLHERVRKLNEQSIKDGTAISKEDLARIWPKGSVSFEVGTSGGSLRRKKEKK
ncbi:hypothetical protein KKA23_01530 [Patescibacteria group bacterium]|nr:hypothetical protein [Patescibacteria group bacterium]